MRFCFVGGGINTVYMILNLNFIISGEGRVEWGVLVIYDWYNVGHICIIGRGMDNDFL
jgi:hypothetical protein